MSDLPTFKEKINLSLVFLSVFALSFWAIPSLAKKENSTNIFTNELQSNGIYKFYLAFMNSELDYFKFYKTLPNNEAYTLLNNLLPGIKGTTTQRTITSDSLEIKKNYEYKHRDNTLTLKLNGDGGTKWLVIGDKVIGLQTNKKHLKDTLTVKHSNSNSEVIQLDKLIDFNIFDTYEEANYNTNAANLKRDKVALEYEKIKYDEKKLISDHIQNEMKNEYNRFTTEIGYKTEVLKLLISENSLYSNELSTSKSNLDFTLKALTGIEGIAIKLIKELF